MKKERLAELHFLIPVIDQKRSSANRQNDPQKEVNYNKPLDSLLLSMSPLSEKIVAFVIDDDERREILDGQLGHTTGSQISDNGFDGLSFHGFLRNIFLKNGQKVEK